MPFQGRFALGAEARPLQTVCNAQKDPDSKIGSPIHLSRPLPPEVIRRWRPPAARRLHQRESATSRVATSGRLAPISHNFFEPAADILDVIHTRRLLRGWTASSRLTTGAWRLRERNVGAAKAAWKYAQGNSNNSGISPVREITGRRDWTRTNDPHHVKVVL